MWNEVAPEAGTLTWEEGKTGRAFRPRRLPSSVLSSSPVAGLRLPMPSSSGSRALNSVFSGAAQPVPSVMDVTGYLTKGEGRTPSSVPTASDPQGILVCLVAVDTTVNLPGGLSV